MNTDEYPFFCAFIRVHPCSSVVKKFAGPARDFKAEDATLDLGLWTLDSPLRGLPPTRQDASHGRSSFMRPLWKGAISFGLVNIPVGLYPATQSGREIKFRMLRESDLS